MPICFEACAKRARLPVALRVVRLRVTPRILAQIGVGIAVVVQSCVRLRTRFVKRGHIDRRQIGAILIKRIGYAVPIGDRRYDLEPISDEATRCSVGDVR